ncbi:MAG TPA: glycosyltransferase family 4 protein [Lutibacter sp.]
MLKIGLVLATTPSYSETFFTSKIRGLQASGYDVTLFVQKKEPHFTDCKVVTSPQVYKKNVLFQLLNALIVVFKLLRYPNRIKKFIQLERKSNRSWKQLLKNTYNNAHLLTADLDWLHFGFATIALQSEHVAEVIDAKMAVSLRGFDMDVYPLKHPNCYLLLWKRVAKVHAISKYMLASAYKLGLPENVPYQIITPAIDISKFKSVAPKNREIPHFLTVARLHWIKGLIYTLEALALLKAKGIAFEYTIIGSGAEYENIAFAIHQLQLTDRVHLVGSTSQEAIIEYLSKTTIYIQYSDSEGFCNAVLEAQAMGLLCVVSDGGALEENVIHTETGWVVPKRNPQKLSEAILRVLNMSNDEQDSVRETAIKRVQTTFNIEKQQQEFINFYQES